MKTAPILTMNTDFGMCNRFFSYCSSYRSFSAID